MPDRARDALLIVNPQAGRVKKILSGKLDRARRTLAEQGIETRLTIPNTPGEAEEAAREAARTHMDFVIVCGGDGTLNAVVNGLAGSHVPLALLPAGTANILAKELHLPQDVERAAHFVQRGAIRRIALGRLTTYDHGVRNRYFLSVGGAGPDGQIVETVDADLKSRTGTLAFWVEGLRQLASYTFPPFRVITGGHASQATMIVVGRTKHYGGPLRITTHADLFGTDFELLMCHTRSRLLYLSYVPLACAGQMHWAPKISFVRTNAFRCEPIDDPVCLQVDGEPAGRLPADFCIVPDSLSLVTPTALPR